MLEVLSRRAVVAGFAGAMVCPAVALAAPTPRAAQLIAAARRQIGITRSYDPAYTRIPFPNGDVPRAIGVCTDVVIRAYRDAFALDLQALVNADMRGHFASYPRRWGLRATDSNIDHRRVPNLQTFFARQGGKLAQPADPASWQPGDLFTSMIRGTLPHIGIVSDRRALGGHPLVIHNIGGGAREEDMLFAFLLTGRYRWRV